MTNDDFALLDAFKTKLETLLTDNSARPQKITVSRINVLVTFPARETKKAEKANQILSKIGLKKCRVFPYFGEKREDILIAAGFFR